MSNCPDKNPLQREGLSQFQRALAALQPDYIKVDERTITEMMDYAAAYAAKAKLRFFDAQGNGDKGETWAHLMDYKKQFNSQDILQELNSRSDFPPHFALFLCFLKLFFEAQNEINTLTKKHLDFYYEDVLKLTNKAPVADHVHIVFTLAKNAVEQIIGKSTELDGGKDALKQPLIYKITDDLTVNRAKIAHLRTVFINSLATKEEDRKVYYAPAANTQDGIAKALNADNRVWNAFGPKPKPQATCSVVDNSIVLPTAQIGFAVASPVLLMAEGIRKITLTLKSDTPLPILSESAISIPTGFALKIQLSGAKAWIDVKKDATVSINDKDEKTISISASTNTLTIVAILGADEKNAVVNFNPNKLDGDYKTTSPVMRCWITNSEHYKILRGVKLDSAKITVDVSNIKKSLTLENDLGKLNAEKPFMPFGPVPVVGSTLYVGCAEALNKTLESVTVKFTSWVGKPENIRNYYADYKTYQRDYNVVTEVGANTVVSDYSKTEAGFTANVEIINGNLKGVNGKAENRKLFTDEANSFIKGVIVDKNSGLTNIWDWYFGFSYFQGGYFRENNRFIMFDSAFMRTQPNDNLPTVSDSLLQIKLNTDFNHAVYPKILSHVITYNGVYSQALPIPNPPYAPLASEFLLSYTASTTEVQLKGTILPTTATEVEKEQNRKTLFDTFSKRDLQLFHLGIFGQAEEHAFLKQELLFLSDKDKNKARLLPEYSDNGSFYIGLQDIVALEAVSILCQMSDGSANPEREAPVVKWSVLCQNQWRLLNSENILSDTTQSFLSSGIIKFELPTETTTANTLFEQGYVWLKAELFTPETTTTIPTPSTRGDASTVSAPIDSVCNFLALHTQAVLAKFSDKQNDSAHYATALAAQTIQKARTGLGAIKKIEQPYTAFGNKPQETDAAFYQRISERLRHKQRAVTIWDYEHLVLQAYPSVFKAKCLNHTYLNKALPEKHEKRLVQLVPGYITMVVVPNLRLLNVVNPLEPKVDLATLAQIKVFLKRHAGLLVHIETTNPDYEPVKLQFNVRFKHGKEFEVYKKVLNQDIMRYLSPWAFDTKADIPFGGTLEKSLVINFIEKLGYVDIVTDFQLSSKKGDFKDDNEEISASSPMAVLVSCSQHDISLFKD
jgi:hypothetical protein